MIALICLYYLQLFLSSEMGKWTGEYLVSAEVGEGGRGRQGTFRASFVPNQTGVLGFLPLSPGAVLFPSVCSLTASAAASDVAMTFQPDASGT